MKLKVIKVIFSEKIIMGKDRLEKLICVLIS